MNQNPPKAINHKQANQTKLEEFDLYFEEVSIPVSTYTKLKRIFKRQTGERYPNKSAQGS